MMHGSTKLKFSNKPSQEATRNSDICYNKFPKSEIEHQEREKSVENLATTMGSHY